MENIQNTTPATTSTPKRGSRYEGKSVDEVIAEALGTPIPATPATPTTTPTTPATPTEPIAPSVSETALNTVQEIQTTLNTMNTETPVSENFAEETAALISRLEKISTPPIRPLSDRDTSGLINVNELFERRPAQASTFTLNDRTITITTPTYDSLTKAVGLATNLILDSGEHYIFGPTRRIISDLVFARELTNVNLEFLTLPEIRMSQLIETYDILKPLIDYLVIPTNTPESIINWYYDELDSSLAAAVQYEHSAQGIVDALAAHNIKDQETLAEQMATLEDNKLSNIIDLMQKIEPPK